MKWKPLLCLAVLPTQLAAYESPRDRGLYLSASVGAGVFLSHLSDSKLNEATFREMAASLHGMGGGATDKSVREGGQQGVRYGGGFAFGYLQVDQKACGPQGCPAPNEELDTNSSAVISPYLRFEWPQMGMTLGVTYFPILSIPLPRVAVRLGPAEGLFFSMEILNGNPVLTEGFIKAGLGGTLHQNQIWIGGELFPYDGFGLGVKVSRDFGPLRAFLGGHVSRGRESFRDSEGDEPAFDAKIIEYAMTLGLEFKL